MLVPKVKGDREDKEVKSDQDGTNNLDQFQDNNRLNILVIIEELIPDLLDNNRDQWVNKELLDRKEWPPEEQPNPSHDHKAPDSHPLDNNSNIRTIQEIYRKTANWDHNLSPPSRASLNHNKESQFPDRNL